MGRLETQTRKTVTKRGEKSKKNGVSKNVEKTEKNGEKRRKTENNKVSLATIGPAFSEPSFLILGYSITETRSETTERGPKR